MNKHVLVRVGGSFTWPPPVTNIRTAVFIAGGVGIKYVARQDGIFD